MCMSPMSHSKPTLAVVLAFGTSKSVSKSYVIETPISAVKKKGLKLIKNEAHASKLSNKLKSALCKESALEFSYCAYIGPQLKVARSWPPPMQT